MSNTIEKIQEINQQDSKVIAGKKVKKSDKDLTVKDRVRAIIGGSIGNLVEWSDVTIFLHHLLSKCMEINHG